MLQPGFPRRVVWALGAALFFMLVVVLRQGPSAVAVSSRRWGNSPSLLDDINNATLGFEKILVVGLSERTDRRDGMVLGAALSNLAVEFVDGVIDTAVPVKAVPKTESGDHIKGASLGSWRGHMNAVQQIVRQNLSSALIIEDDTDWDISIRRQLRDFALSTRALTQPLRANRAVYADPTYPRPNAESLSAVPEISFDRLPQTIPPNVSPYGDDWDVLWVGHCGMSFPFEESKTIPKGRVIHRDDATVPGRSHLWSLNSPFTLKDNYPEHTTAVHHVQEGICTLAYAVSQAGARKMLRHIALREASDKFDFLLRYFCEGDKGRPRHNCLTSQPGYFQHHRPIGFNKDSSDIDNHGEGFRPKAETDMIRWSVRLNADVLLAGGTDYIDQFPEL
ncbi:glycosyltransferase family 25 protein [Hirsutella rhossiliensis]|uniref:Glycosyltransferase family 25 protein n=1 Tax=Hirsutella rhossiliensis TaxID=111463 RepID=A0A9P8MNU3_9HYPO|nr:glycosyltransferase family 25 protein [Hirsutella rhossiliensis]KAH0959608.1 glycosyltransferase family 25 protein [Hirsutella rhossiliensis]